MRLTERILRLEQAVNNEPMLTLDVDTSPTPEQYKVIEQCERTNRRLLVFFEPGNTAWLAGNGAPPWEV